MSEVKNKRTMREMQRNDPMAPKRHEKGTKSMRKAKKFEEEMSRKHSKEDLAKAHKHMKMHGG